MILSTSDHAPYRYWFVYSVNSGIIVTIMATNGSFDDRLFEMYSSTAGDMMMPRLYDEQIGQLFPVVFDKALVMTAEEVGEVISSQREILERTNFWPATITYMRSFQDERWDVSKQLPTTDKYHSDMALPTLMGHLSDMFIGYHRIREVHSQGYNTVEEHVKVLEEKAVGGVMIDSTISRIILALGVRYGTEAIGPAYEEIVLHHMGVSEREARSINPDGDSLGWSLFEDAQLHGAPLPRREDVADFFEGVTYILQFQKTAVMMDTLGSLSEVSPQLQKFSSDFYKQHKTMLFAEKPERTNQALEKLLRLLTERLNESKDVDMARQAVTSALTYLTGRKDFSDAFMQLEIGILMKIVGEGYEQNRPTA